MITARSPCWDCTPVEIITWVPSTVETSSCATTSSMSAWWPSSSTQTVGMASEITSSVVETATVTQTITMSKTITLDSTETLTCCVRPQRRDVGVDFLIPHPTPVRPTLVPHRRWKGDTEASPTTQISFETVTVTATAWTHITVNPGGNCMPGLWCDGNNSGYPTPVSAFPPSTPSSISGGRVSCDCSLAWTNALQGSVPNHGADLAASVIFFFLFLLFLLTGISRILRCLKQYLVLLVFLPSVIFAGGMMIWMGIRAYVSNHVAGARSSHVLGLNVILLCFPCLLVDTAVQIFGLLERRTERSGLWIKYLSYVVRVANLCSLMMYIIAATNLGSFLTTWINLGTGCDTSLAQSLSLLPLLSDFVELIVLVLLTLLLVYIRIRYCLPVAVLVHVLLIHGMLGIHFLWKTIRDWTAQDIWQKGWGTWWPISLNTKAPDQVWSSCLASLVLDPSTSDGSAKTIMWGVVANIIPRMGAESPAVLWMLGILPLLLALLLIYMVNIPLYVTAERIKPPPGPGKKARYEFVYNNTTDRIELNKIVEAQTSASVKASGDKAGGSGSQDKGKAKQAEKTDSSDNRTAQTSKNENVVEEDDKTYFKVTRGLHGKWRIKPVSEKQRFKGVGGKMRKFALGWSAASA